ncbi:MAG: Mu-like prophage major head subunit gpT family protein [Myxococcota bacterium]
MNAEELSALVAEAGFPVMMEAYEREPLFYPELCEVIPHDPAREFGEKQTVITGIGEFREKLEGQEYEATEMIQGPSFYLKVRELGRRLPLSGRLVEMANAQRPGTIANIGDLIAAAAESAGLNAREKSESIIAGMFQKGTLTAGSSEHFNGTFNDNNTITADPYPKFIYTGQPWFDTAHPITVGSSTFKNHEASLTLSEDNYNTVRVRMTTQNNRDERNNRVMIRPDTLLVPPGLQKTALQIIDTPLQPGGELNDVNVSRGTAAVMSWSYLDDAASSAAWWVTQRGRGSGIRVRDSGDPVIRIAYDPLKNEWNIIFSKKFGAAVTDWRYAYCANKAA